MDYREIFVFVVGVTPQVVTETLYALHMMKPPVHPDEIHIITTAVGKAKAEEELVNRGRLEAFCREFDIKSVRPEIHTMMDPEGNLLDDIRTAEDNECIGDYIARFVREKTRDRATRLHCSLAGGRKTMSFYLGSAMTLFGRARDKLYHVLVSPKFESLREFYWKPRKDRVIEIREGEERILKRLNTREAEIHLAELPYIRLREKFPLEGFSFRDLVRSGQKEIDTAAAQPALEVNLEERTIRAGEKTIEVVPMQLVVYSAFLREKLKRCRYPERPYCGDCTDCFLLINDLAGKRALGEMSADYDRSYGGKGYKAEELKGQWPEGMTTETIRQNISKVNRLIRENIADETLASFYVVTSVGSYGNKRYGVKVDKGKIGMT